MIENSMHGDCLITGNTCREYRTMNQCLLDKCPEKLQLQMVTNAWNTIDFICVQKYAGKYLQKFHIYLPKTNFFLLQILLLTCLVFIFISKG